ncbi:cupin domain-containing protein [Haloparvum sedimenti]|uniref:cupin domain-containing protein n=1 Tax=Haloparvum sedimenti TaxID=1678448 RepID=UPI00071E8FD1|nr:cupin domain-containing protein [Haloparvum sedimenti]
MDEETVDVSVAFDDIEELWAPKIAAELNGQHVKLARLEGTFDWHRHEEGDELFYVLDGELRIEFRDRPDATLTENQLRAVPAGVEHRPVAEEEVRVMLFEPAGTRNTGNVETEKTSEVERL